MMMKLMNVKNNKGFTLVELMIVVAIIGILAAIAIPAFLRAIKKSKTSEAEGIMRKMADGSKAYFTSEQKCSAPYAQGGAEGWHDGVGPCDDPAKNGLPVPWTQYTFPGGPGFSFNTTVGAGTGPDGPSSPTGGAKQIPFVGGTVPTPDSRLGVTLNRLTVDFKDPIYFQYAYVTGAAPAQDAQVTITATANFKDGGQAHTITQIVGVDDDSQEVTVGPASTTFEFE